LLPTTIQQNGLFLTFCNCEKSTDKSAGRFFSLFLMSYFRKSQDCLEFEHDLLLDKTAAQISSSWAPRRAGGNSFSPFPAIQE
jgi:hypothetical protein